MGGNGIIRNSVRGAFMLVYCESWRSKLEKRYLLTKLSKQLAADLATNWLRPIGSFTFILRRFELLESHPSIPSQ